ncbi:MAG TPA: DinB family protein [Mycobacteriales bacterium]|nr:DinB family protein [Mycobacteriales bacterium]
MNLIEEMVRQLDWHWQHAARPRLEGLTDDEYFWEPVPDCWNVRRRGESTAPIAAGSGDFTVDFAFPEPDPAPVTTISWRLTHIIVGVLGMRIAGHFDGPPIDYPTYDYPGTAAAALKTLDEFYATWIGHVRALTPEELAAPVGPTEGPFAEHPMIELVLHINREMIHHLAEIALLRDLYAHRTAN